MIWLIGYVAIAIVCFGASVYFDNVTKNPSIRFCVLVSIAWPLALLFLIGILAAYLLEKIIG